MPFNKPLPEWKNPGVKPNQGLIDAGWKPDDKPPADVHNWWMNTSYVALEQLQNEAINKDQIGVANGVAPLGDDGKVPASMVSGNTAEIETQLENHINKDLGHVRFAGGASGQNAMVISIPNAIVRNPDVANPIPETGYAFRFVKNTGANSTNVTLQIDYGNGKTSLSYPVLYPDGKQLSSGAIIAGGIYTVAFSGTTFFLQGSGSGVVKAVRGNQTFNIPGSFNFTVPDGVSLITCYLFGAGGGGGGGGKLDGSGNFSGGGGGGGAFALRMLQVTPGTNLTVYVGEGGNGGNPGNNGTSGLYSYVRYITPTGDSKTYYAYGGGGGGSGNLGPGNGGGGGTPTATGNGSSVTTPIDGALVGPFLIGLELQAYSGGSGGYTGSSTVSGGGGGSSPSDIAPGKAANSNNGGIIGISNRLSVPGGDGGSGGNANSSGGRDGDAPGGGGGGGAGYGGTTYMRGGKGGNGRVVLVW